MPVIMKILLVLFAVFFSVHASAQAKLLGRSRSEIENKVRNDPYPGNQITDSTISYFLPGEDQSFIRVTCHFSEAGKCNMVVVHSSHTRAYRQYLATVLAERKYRWRKINGNQYVSKFSKRMLLETDPDFSINRFRILPTSWTRKTYRML